jgi:hypothetical protein
MKKIIFVILLLFVLFSFYPLVFTPVESANIPTKEEMLEAVVSKIIEEKQIEVLQKKQLYQRLN